MSPRPIQTRATEDRNAARPLRPARILFAFENPLPSPQADAEVFVNTARALATLFADTHFHVPLSDENDATAIRALVGMPVVPARAPNAPAALRHFCCGLTLPLRRAYWRADLVYTRNLWVAWVATTFGRDVVFDHYRPWSRQVPPLGALLHRLHARRRFLLNICHSDYTRRAYAELGAAPDKLHRVYNGFDPSRLAAPVSLADAKRALGIDANTRTVVYTGRLNGRKGLDLVLAAAARRPDILFILVGSAGHGRIEALAASQNNVRIVGWQEPPAMMRYLAAADILLIPPSSEPLQRFGSTVLPLKVFLYMAAGRPILAGATPDVREILRDRDNALLCRIDDVGALAAGIDTLLGDDALAARLAAAARADSAALTWDARARRIAALIEAKRAGPRSRGGPWGVAQRRAWRTGSGRWLVHLLRTRSWVLPPDPAHRDDAPETGARPP